MFARGIQVDLLIVHILGMYWRLWIIPSSVFTIQSDLKLHKLSYILWCLCIL